MVMASNNLNRRASAAADEAVNFDKQLARLDDDIRKLKIEFDIYFNGSTKGKRPPLEARARLEALIRRLSDNRSITYAQRYQLSMLVSRYSSFRELWRRLLRAKGEELI